ncbi:MAG: hypothetical protein WCW84_03555 [Sulfurimonas sp.]|jgi:hypothetical protein
MKKFNVLPEKVGIVLTSRELDQNYTATCQLCQGRSLYQVEIEREKND